MTKLTEKQAQTLDRGLGDIKNEFELKLPMYFYFSVISANPAIVQFNRNNALPEAAKEKVKVLVKETYCSQPSF